MINAERLRLVPLDLDLARAQMEDLDHFFCMLGAERPPDWPPPLTGEETSAYTLERLTLAPDQKGWWQWVFLKPGESGAPATVVGVIGFSGPPDIDGEVEIGYSVRDSLQRRGYAPEAVEALVGWAFRYREVVRVIAHTLKAEDLEPSRKVLRRCGFHGPLDGPEPGVVRFERDRGSRE